MVSTTAGNVSNVVEGSWHSHGLSIPLAVLGWEDDVFQRKWECILESFTEKKKIIMRQKEQDIV